MAKELYTISMKKTYLISFALLALILLFVWQKGIVPNQSLNIKPPVSGIPTTTPAENLSLTVPSGFVISSFAKGVTGARVISFAPDGVLLVSETSQGKVVALPDKNDDGKADEIVTVVSGLKQPHGMAFRCTDPNNPSVCALYIAETDSVSQFEYDPVNFKATGKKKLVDLPSGGRHFTRTLLFMPSPNENTLLISVGSSCDVCNESDSRRAKVLAYDIGTKKLEEFSRGLRNSVFMQIHPVTGAIWATEMGRDYLGDSLPPDEINILQKGANYGWPNCYGNNVHDAVFDTRNQNSCALPNQVPSHIELPAHGAPLGLDFFPEEGWPEEYWYNSLVALHGSWNRNVPDGYKIVRIKLDAQGKYSGSFPAGEDFITGWLKADGTKTGRPVDIKILPGGVMYISDDLKGTIYRVSRM